MASIVSRIAAPIFKPIATFMWYDNQETATGSVLQKNMFLKISQNSQENLRDLTTLYND